MRRGLASASSPDTGSAILKKSLDAPFCLLAHTHVKREAAKRRCFKGLNGRSKSGLQEWIVGMGIASGVRLSAPMEPVSMRVERSAWACGPPGARSGVLGRSPNGDALSRPRRSLARHVAASVRNASVSVSLTAFTDTTKRRRLEREALSRAAARVSVRRALAWARSAHAALQACVARVLRAHGRARRSTTMVGPRGPGASVPAARTTSTQIMRSDGLARRLRRIGS